MPSDPHSSRDTSKPATFFITWPPKRSSSPRRVQQMRAEHEVACCAGAGATRPGQARGNYAAERADRRRNAAARTAGTGCVRASALSISDSGVPQRAVTTSSRGLVVDDAGIAARIEQVAAQRFAVEILRAGATQTQRRVVRMRRDDAVAQYRRARVHRVQNRGSSANGNAPPCTCMRPYSAQRASVGIALPGLSRPRSSNARLTAKNASRSAVENCTHIELIFSMPTPCSPVIVPPSSHAQFENIRAERVGAFPLAGCVGVEQDQRMQVAVAGVKHVHAAQIVLFLHRLDARSIWPRCLRGIVPSMQ